MTIQTVSIVITTIVTILVALITIGQWNTNRSRLRHELFDRRYKIYETIAYFLANISIENRICESDCHEFLIKTNQVYFVFGCDQVIKNLVNEIYKLAVEFDTLSEMTKTLAVNDDQWKDTVKHKMVIKRKLQDIFDSLECKFEKYLRLIH